jgi:NADH-quinone oxidoreductase subunit E
LTDPIPAPAAGGEPPAISDAAKPAVLSAPRDGKPDDLKRISGVGPKIEGILNGLGVYHYDQIAKWSAEQVDWVDEHLKFKGRIAREGWIDQAKILAADGEIDISRRSDAGAT